MQTGNSGYPCQRLVTSSTYTPIVSGIGVLRRRQFGTNRVLHTRIHSHGVKTTKPRLSRLNVSATRDLPLPNILADPDFDREGSLENKRTVFNFGNWATHRSTDRYTRHLGSILGVKSRVFKGLLRPVLTATAIATAIATYETLRETGVLPAQLPGVSIETNAPFSLTSFALSLLLVFRTNTSYARWAEAREIWGGVTNRSRDILRQALTFVPEGNQELVDMFARWSIAYSKVLACHLREDGDVHETMKGILPPEELSDLAASPHPPNYVLGILSELAASTCFSSPERYRMEQNITFFHDCHGKCERILMTPIPLSYTRLTGRFLVIWPALIPFTLWKGLHWAMVPASAIITFLLLGIEEIGVQIEEPFSILPLETMAATIETNLREMVEINGNARRLVQRVSKESIATTGNHGNGCGQADAEFAASGNDGHSQDANGHNGNGGNSNGGNGIGNGNGNWVSRLKQFAGVVEQEI